MTGCQFYGVCEGRVAMRKKSRNLSGMLRLACQSLYYFPEGILAGDLALGKLEQVNPPHFNVLP